MEAALSELKRKLRSIWPHLDERTRRLTAANEAMSLGYGGVSLVHQACGLSRKAILKGMREIRTDEALVPGRIRRPGAGRKSITVSDPELFDFLDELIEGYTRGDPEFPLRCICKSTRAIARRLSARRHPVSHVKVAQLLRGESSPVVLLRLSIAPFTEPKCTPAGGPAVPLGRLRAVSSSPP